MATTAPRNLLTVLEVSYANDPQRTGFGNKSLMWVPAIVSLDEFEAGARHGSITVCEARREGPKLHIVPELAPLVNMLITPAVFVEAYQRVSVITVFEIGSRDTLMCNFHLRFELAAEWMPFLQTTLQLSTESASYHAEIYRGLSAAAASMYNEQADAIVANPDAPVEEPIGVEQVISGVEQVTLDADDQVTVEQIDVQQAADE